MKDPDYHHLGDHTETVQIDFDPQRITYNDLLVIFWESHKPTQRPWKRQYLHAVFYHNETQRQAALASKKAVEAEIGREVRTEILPVRTFYRAEDYHQKYLLKRRPELAKAMTGIYPRKKDYVDSTAVARLNGYAGGYGSSQQLGREIDQLGLSAENRQSLLKLVGSN